MLILWSPHKGDCGKSTKDIVDGAQERLRIVRIYHCARSSCMVCNYLLLSCLYSYYLHIRHRPINNKVFHVVLIQLGVPPAAAALMRKAKSFLEDRPRLSGTNPSLLSFCKVVSSLVEEYGRLPLTGRAGFSPAVSWETLRRFRALVAVVVSAAAGPFPPLEAARCSWTSLGAVGV